jgi:hypothetical protein
MVTDFFGVLLQELSRLMGISELRPDRNNSCLINMQKGYKVQLEVDSSGRYLIIGCDLGEVPTGRYRETIFMEALKINGMPSVLNGHLAYSKKLNHLILFEMLDLTNINGDKVFAVMTPFLEKAAVWKDAITRGEIPVMPAQASTMSHMPFGMR